MKIDFSSQQIQGGRNYQEDAVAMTRIETPTPGVLLVVCDGMGGHDGGDVASNTACKAFLGAFLQSGFVSPEDRLFAALNDANDAIAQVLAKEPRLQNMGTTLIACFATNDDVYWISVGDSLLMRVRDGEIERVNADHSMAPVLDELARRGEMTAQAAAGDERRNMLRSALNGGHVPLIDIGNRKQFLAEGDVLLLASDGLCTLSPQALAELVSANDVAPAASLAGMILEAVTHENVPGQDNTSIIVLRCKEGKKRRGVLARMFSHAT